MTNIMRGAVLSLVLLAGACVSAEEQARRWAAADDAECRSLGFVVGTDSYGNCRLQLQAIRAQDMQARAAIFGAVTQ